MPLVIAVLANAVPTVGAIQLLRPVLRHIQRRRQAKSALSGRPNASSGDAVVDELGHEVRRVPIEEGLCVLPHSCRWIGEVCMISAL